MTGRGVVALVLLVYAALFLAWATVRGVAVGRDSARREEGGQWYR